MPHELALQLRDDFVAPGVGLGERDDRGRHRDTDERADRAEERRTCDDRPERDGGVDVHGLGTDTWGEPVVLHLLVHGGEDDHPHRVEWLV